MTLIQFLKLGIQFLFIFKLKIILNERAVTSDILNLYEIIFKFPLVKSH